MEAESSAEREQLLANLQEGQVVKGIVKNLTDYGAFVDLGGIDGLLHVTDISYKRVQHPSEVLNIGDTVRVQIIRINKDTQRISLGMKQLERGGPSTGLPTKTEQSDLYQAVYGRNGDAPMPVLAARSAADCFEVAIEAVRIAPTKVKAIDTTGAGDAFTGALAARLAAETGAEVLVAGDASCLMHIGGLLSRQRSGVRTMHLAEVLASTADEPAGAVR
mgnify:CR=1 FL=1